ncbi:MAG TPA: hypothetical protein VF221_22555 [Chloroflexota bacterium]
MTTLAWLAIAYAVAFVINVIPAFMPATWAVLAFFYVHYKLPLLLLTVGGAAFSSLGRLVLALATRRWGRKFVPAKQRREIDALGTWLEQRPAWQIPLAVFIFSLVGVIPSNQLFIAAGLTTIRLAPVVLGFFAGRVISYTVAAVATSKVTYSLDALLKNYLSSPSAWLIQLLSLAAVVGFTMIPWTKVLHIPVPSTTVQTQSKA